MKKIIATSIAALALLAGCSTVTNNIDPKTNSEALQVARAATLFEVRDQEIPQTEFDRLADNTAYNAAWATTMYFNPAMGFSSGSSLALALPALLLNNKPKDSFNHVLAWMPKELADNPENAVDKMNGILLEALEKTATYFDQSNYTTGDFKSRGRHITYIDIEDESLECSLQEGFFCSLVNRINTPRLTISPNVLQKQGEQPVYFFPLRKDHTLMFVERREELKKQDQLEIITTYSKNLPDWVYLYIAPKTIHNTKGELLEYPFILHQGKTLLFVKPQKVN